MTNSAEPAEPMGREAKMRRTRIAITEHARKLTATHGLSGYTVEEICAPVGISRRTFFNYFASKEAAVVGHPPDALDSDAMRRFVADGVADGCISPTLLDDLVEATIEALDEVLDIAGTHTHVHAIIAREPSFMEKFITESEQVNEQLASMIATREGLAVDDPRPKLAIQLLGGLIHSTAHEFFTGGAAGTANSIGPELRRTLKLSRELFTPGPTEVPG